MRSPVLSIIVPVYNVEKYLERCIQSILDQNIADCEIILVDDGSTDNSGLICDNFQKIDYRIKVIHNNNEGLSIARNRGLNIATGSYFTFVDSDDYLINPNIYTTCLQLFSNNDQLDCIQFSFNQVDLNGNFIKSVIAKNRVYTSIQDLFSHIENVAPESEYIIKDPVWNKVYRSKTLGHYRFKPHVKFEDAIYTADLFESIRCMESIPDIGYAYVCNPDSIMNQNMSLGKASDAIESNLHVLRKAIESGLSNEKIMLSNFLYRIIYEILCLKIIYSYDFSEIIFSSVDTYVRTYNKADTSKKRLFLSLVKYLGSRNFIKLFSKLNLTARK